MSEPIETQVICKDCGHNVTGKFCSYCGEKVYTIHDRKLSHLLDESIHFITHLDGSFLRTAKTIFTNPGQLSTDYCNGIRKKYFKPISFFLVLVVIYLLFPVFEGLNQRLEYHLNSLYGHYAEKRIAAIMQNSHLTMKQMEEAFHAKGEKVSKFLLLLIIPATALLLQLFTFKKHRLFFDQVIFATEINIFYLLWGFLLLPFITTVSLYIIRFITGRELYLFDFSLGIVLFAVMIIYVKKASRKFYTMKRFPAIIFSIGVVGLEILFIQFVYKFILFWLITEQLH